MKSEQLVLALIAIVVGVLGWQTYRQFAGRRAVSAQPAPAATTTASTFNTSSVLRAFNPPEAEVVAALRAPKPDAAPAAPSETMPPLVTYTAEDLRDPFSSALPQEAPQATATPAAMPQEPPPTLHLQGLMYGNGVARAIIDGHIVGEGDYIGKLQVIQIMRDGVLLGTPMYRFLLHTHSTPKK